MDAPAENCENLTWLGHWVSTVTQFSVVKHICVITSLML
jgi:hypothetical protein